MRLARVSLFLPVVTAFHPAPSGALPRARARSFVALTADLPQPADDVKITIRKRSSDARRAVQEDSSHGRVFTAKFGHVKKSLSTFLKFWLMGGCGASDWVGTGELEAQHNPSGTTASIEIDVESSTVSLRSPAASSTAGNEPLGAYAIALLDELELLAKSEEAAAADRLCYPAEAVDSVRLAAWAACAPREAPAATTSPIGGDADGGGSETEFQVDADGGSSETEFQAFLKSLKKE